MSRIEDIEAGLYSAYEATTDVAMSGNSNFVTVPDSVLDWRQHGFAALGAERDRMTPEEIHTIQMFLGGAWSR